MFHVAYAQEEKPVECGTVFRPELNKYHIDEVEAITKFTADRANFPLTTETVPVRLTVYNGPTLINNVSQANMDQAIANLNAAFSGTGLNFVQCGPINFIYRKELSLNEDFVNFLPRFSYTSGALEVKLNISTFSAALHPCPDAYIDVNPNYYYGDNCTLYDNMLSVGNLNAFLSSSMAHEVGHHFGLFHTFMNEGTVRHTPVDTNQVDHPYPVLDLNDEIIPTWWGRELVIRQNEPPSSLKVFKFQNSLAAGDLVSDTPADCIPNSSNLYPGCPLSAQIAGCTLNNTLTYKDYNEDAINPAPSGLSLGRNYMSYWVDTCRNQFTNGQRERILYYYNTYRKTKYAPEKCGLFDDKIEFEGSNTGIPVVTIRTRHTNDARVSNVTTSPEGTFSGLLFNNTLKARIYHNGLGAFTPAVTQNQVFTDSLALISRYLHTPCEWTRGVTVTDIVAIQKHILGLEPLTSGYSIIAADASKNNQVTVFDIVELRKLILGIYTKLPAFEQPWRFVPEFVPLDNSSTFNTTPFSMTIGGNNIGAAYLEQDWEFTVPTSLSKRGFDAIKIGDVNSSWPTAINCENLKDNEDEAEKPALLVPAVSLDEEDEVELKFKIAAFSDITAYQLGFRLDPELLEIQDVEKVTPELQEYNKTDHFSIEADSGYVRTLWLDTSLEGKSLNQDSIVFSLLVKAKTFVPNLQSAISIDWMALPSVFMDENGVVEKIEDVSIEVNVEYKSEERSETLRSSDATGAFLRCFPNPFSDKMHIVFDYEGSATGGLLTVTNMFGQNVTERNVNIQKGRNVITVNGLGDISKGAHIATLILDGNSYQVQIIKK